MEHRSSFRAKSLHRAHIEKRNICLGCFYATNIGYGGAFISGFSTSIATGTVVTVVGDIPRNSETPRYRMSAMVVHVSADGVGLMWIESDSTVQSMLADILPVAA